MINFCIDAIQLRNIVSRRILTIAYHDKLASSEQVKVPIKPERHAMCNISEYAANSRSRMKDAWTKRQT